IAQTEIVEPPLRTVTPSRIQLEYLPSSRRCASYHRRQIWSPICGCRRELPKCLWLTTNAAAAANFIRLLPFDHDSCPPEVSGLQHSGKIISSDTFLPTECLIALRCLS